jgi:hypothetical protein
VAEYRVTDPETGRTLKLTGDSPPTEAELEEIFASQDRYASGSAPTFTGEPTKALNNGQDIPEPPSMWGGEGVSMAMGVADYPIGLIQSILQPPQYAKEGTGPDLGINPDQAYTPIRDAATAGHEGITNAMRDIDQKISEGMIENGRGEGTDWWRAGGNIAGMIRGSRGMKAPENLRQLSKQGGLLGTVSGGLRPTTSDDPFAERAMNVAIEGGGGALFSPVIPLGVSGAKAVGDALKAGVRTGRNLIDPFIPGGYGRARDRMMRELIGNENLPQVQRSLEGPLDPTLMGGEAAARSGVTEIPALQNVGRKVRPTEYYEKLGAQRAQRLGELDNVGGTADELTRAQGVRSANANEAYARAYENSVKGDMGIQTLLKDIGGFLPSVLKSAGRLARVNGIKLVDGKIPNADFSKYGHYIKIALDKALARTGDKALDKTEKKAVKELQERLVGWIGGKNKDYDAARAGFAADSIPVNRGQVGQAIKESLTGPLGEKETARRMAAAMADAPRTIKNATGSSRFGKLSEVLSDEGERSANRVLGRLENQATSEEMAALASPRVNEILGRIGKDHPPTLLNRLAMLANNVLSRAGSSRQGQVLEDIAQAVINGPQALREIVPDMTGQQAQQIINYMQQLPTMQPLLRSASGIVAQQGNDQ